MNGHRGRVSKRTDGRKGWRLEVDTINAATGKRRRVVRSGFKTKGEATAALDLLLGEREQGRVPGRSPKVGEWLAGEWLPAMVPTVEPTTARLYQTTVRAYIAPHIGGVRLSDVTAGTLNALYGTLGERLAPKTIRNTHGVVHRAFKDAVRWGLLSVNPADSANPPKVPQTEPATWTAAELGVFLQHVTSDRLAALWRVLATTGLRRGEVVGLRWEDVHIDQGYLSVVRSRTEYGGEQFESDPKTAAGRRRVALDAVTVEAFRSHRDRQRFEQRSWGDGYQQHELVFAREDGSPLRPSLVTRQLPKLAAAAGLPRLTPHGLRHGWATMALEAGVHPKVVSQRLGHASVQITLDRYSHVIEGLDQQAANQVAGLIDRRVTLG